MSLCAAANETVDLRGGRKHGTNSDVVGTIGDGLFGFFNGGSADSDDGILW